MLLRSIRWLALLPALLLPTLGYWPDAAWSERGPVSVQGLAAGLDDANAARVIVRYRVNSELARLAGPRGRAQQAGRLAARLALPLRDGRALGPHTQALRGQGLGSRQLAARLAAQPDVEWAVVDERRHTTAVPNDPFYGDNQSSITPMVGQWYLRKPDSTILSAIDAETAWDLGTGAPTLTVAVLDTGVRFDHPDLAGKLHPGYDFVREANANDGDGFDSDASDPGSWSVASDSCGAKASSWHGTQVAGLVGANTGNGIGMASVGRQLMVLPVRVLGRCGGFDSDVIAGMRWAAGLDNSAECARLGTAATVAADCNPHPARVLNLSLGAFGDCTDGYRTVVAELNRANVVVVASAGNAIGQAVDAPGNCSGVIAVAGLRHAGTKVGYSSVGPEVALAAPAGNCVNEVGACLYPLLTTTNSGSTSPGANTYSDSFNASLGTSFSSPLVAGTVGLMLSLNPALTPAQVRNLLTSTARPFPSSGAQTPGTVACRAPNASPQVECYCTTSTCGAGMLDAGAAMAGVAASLAPSALIAVSTSNPTVGVSVLLDGRGSTAIGGRALVGYRWAIVGGGNLASLSGATDGPTATLATRAAGSVQISLTVTDSAGVERSTSQTLVVVSAPTVVISASSSAPTAGTAVTLSSAGSVAATGRSLASFRWAISSAAGVAALTGATDGATATLATSAAGSVVVTLTVTDSAGASQRSDLTLQVAAAPAAASGGGALGAGWLAGLGLAVWALRRLRPPADA